MAIGKVALCIIVASWVAVWVLMVVVVWCRFIGPMLRRVRTRYIRRDGREYHTGDDWPRSRTDHRPWYK